MNTQSQATRCAIVQEYLDRLTNSTLKLICLLFMQGGDDDSVRRNAHLSRKQLATAKATIAHGLLEAGIIPRN